MAARAQAAVQSRTPVAHGAALRAVGCLRFLLSPTSPYAIRAASYEELVVRYGMNVPFEVELCVRQQGRFLKEIALWSTSKAGDITPGRWYFADRPQP